MYIYFLHFHLMLLFAFHTQIHLERFGVLCKTKRSSNSNSENANVWISDIQFVCFGSLIQLYSHGLV